MSRGLVQTCQKLIWVAAVLACMNSRSAAAQATPSEATVAAFRADIVGSFNGGGGGGNDGGGGRKLLQGGANLRTLVRLGFHDCVSNSGTCDGCIDLQDPENNGLADAVNTLEPICNTHAIGLADCYAAGASIATEELSNGAIVPMFFGRADAPSCGPFNGNAEGTFPAGEDGFNPTMNYMANTFGFTQRETVAIMGVHSLGQANPENSGFDGAWTGNQDNLDNAFFDDMINDPWNPEQQDSGLWQWTNNQNRLMLNSDMCLFKDITFNNGESGEPTCDFQDCGASPTADIAQEYSGDNAQFLLDFSAALVKMLTKGYNGGADLAQAGGDDVAATPADGADLAVASATPVGLVATDALPPAGAGVNGNFMEEEDEVEIEEVDIEDVDGGGGEGGGREGGGGEGGGRGGGGGGGN